MEDRKISIAVIGGGTATNDLVSTFKALSPSINYVLPILDNGGSTSELIRVIGGPAIGDLRSRLTRLIPESQEPLRRLLSFRLSSDSETAKAEWNEIVEGSHYLWIDIMSSTREIIRAFFVHVHVELLKRSKHHFSTRSKTQFRYELASVGNLFLTGVRLFIGSLDSAIELFARLTEIDVNTLVLPCINTNFSYHISALLENGFIITGQSQISHPSESGPAVDVYPPPISTTRPPTPTESDSPGDYWSTQPKSNQTLNVPINEVATTNLMQRPSDSVEFDDSDEESGSVPQYTHPELKKSQLHFCKTDNVRPLLSPIKRIFYISPYGQEICPVAYNRVTNTLATADAIVYSIGSLMTSIVPVVILRGVGKAIASDLTDNQKKKKRILLLNGCLDRETFGMTAADFVKVIVDLALYSILESKPRSSLEIEESNLGKDWTNFITHLVYMKDPKIKVDRKIIEEKKVSCIEVDRVTGEDSFELKDLEKKLSSIIHGH
ncbi:uncharacterized protein PRCAT00001791001 [Priceomyces carsonii]|uniref:uncharacterized protein n=1 Tax=Priceomyces carsonii TaxID=28549 RepID=UPI002ED79635|nr:unnamed protein product [Priceomyces carsonii]